MNSILSAVGLTKTYGGAPALNNVSIEIPAGGTVGLLGPNGSGKSTFIKLAMGLLQPTSGEIFIDGNRPGVETKRMTAYLPDTNFLTDWMTVGQMMDYCADFFDDFSKEKARAMLSRLSISEKQRVRALSKGNKEKVGLILTMARDARLYILDEPIAGVDPAARDYILDTVFSNRAPDSTVILCTHLIYDVQNVLTQAIFLYNGTIALNANVADLCEKEGKPLDEIFKEMFRWSPNY